MLSNNYFEPEQEQIKDSIIQGQEEESGHRRQESTIGPSNVSKLFENFDQEEDDLYQFGRSKSISPSKHYRGPIPDYTYLPGSRSGVQNQSLAQEIISNSLSMTDFNNIQRDAQNILSDAHMFLAKEEHRSKSRRNASAKNVRNREQNISVQKEALEEIVEHQDPLESATIQNQEPPRHLSEMKIQKTDLKKDNIGSRKNQAFQQEMERYNTLLNERKQISKQRFLNQKRPSTFQKQRSQTYKVLPQFQTIQEEQYSPVLQKVAPKKSIQKVQKKQWDDNTQIDYSRNNQSNLRNGSNIRSIQRRNELPTLDLAKVKSINMFDKEEINYESNLGKEQPNQLNRSQSQSIVNMINEQVLQTSKMLGGRLDQSSRSRVRQQQNETEQSAFSKKQKETVANKKSGTTKKQVVAPVLGKSVSQFNLTDRAPKVTITKGTTRNLHQKQKSDVQLASFDSKVQLLEKKMNQTTSEIKGLMQKIQQKQEQQKQSRAQPISILKNKSSTQGFMTDRHQTQKTPRRGLEIKPEPIRSKVKPTLDTGLSKIMESHTYQKTPTARVNKSPIKPIARHKSPYHQRQDVKNSTLQKYQKYSHTTYKRTKTPTGPRKVKNPTFLMDPLKFMKFVLKVLGPQQIFKMSALSSQYHSAVLQTMGYKSSALFYSKLQSFSAKQQVLSTFLETTPKINYSIFQSIQVPVDDEFAIGMADNFQTISHNLKQQFLDSEQSYFLIKLKNLYIDGTKKADVLIMTSEKSAVQKIYMPKPSASSLENKRIRVQQKSKFIGLQSSIYRFNEITEIFNGVGQISYTTGYRNKVVTICQGIFKNGQLYGYGRKIDLVSKIVECGFWSHDGKNNKCVQSRLNANGSLRIAKKIGDWSEYMNKEQDEDQDQPLTSEDLLPPIWQQFYNLK